MTSFSPAIAVFSFIASTVALVFIIIGIVKMSKNIKTKTQNEVLKEAFSSLSFVALIIIYAANIETSLYNVVSGPSGGFYVCSTIYNINSLASSILFLVFFNGVEVELRSVPTACGGFQSYYSAFVVVNHFV